MAKPVNSEKPHGTFSLASGRSVKHNLTWLHIVPLSLTDVHDLKQKEMVSDPIGPSGLHRERVIQTYHCHNYPNNSEEEKWYQHIADCHVSIWDGRRWSGAVHCI